MSATIKVQGTELSQALWNAGLFTSRDATLPVICRVGLDWTERGMCAVGTDRYNLARQDIESAEVTCDMPGMVSIDQATARQLWALKGKPYDAPTVITISDNGVVIFECPGGLILTSHPLDGCPGFANWRSTYDNVAKSCAGPDKPGSKAPARQKWTADHLAKLARVKGGNAYVTVSSAPSKQHSLATFDGLPLSVAMMRVRFN